MGLSAGGGWGCLLEEGLHSFVGRSEGTGSTKADQIAVQCRESCHWQRLDAVSEGEAGEFPLCPPSSPVNDLCHCSMKVPIESLIICIAMRSRTFPNAGGRRDWATTCRYRNSVS